MFKLDDKEGIWNVADYKIYYWVRKTGQYVHSKTAVI